MIRRMTQTTRRIKGPLLSGGVALDDSFNVRQVIIVPFVVRPQIWNGRSITPARVRNEVSPSS